MDYDCVKHIFLHINMYSKSDIYVEGLGCSSGSERGCVSPCFSILVVLNMQYNMYIGEHTSALQDRVQGFEKLCTEVFQLEDLISCSDKIFCIHCFVIGLSENIEASYCRML